MNVRNKMS